jgi:hypothetical protein
MASTHGLLQRVRANAASAPNQCAIASCPVSLTIVLAGTRAGNYLHTYPTLIEQTHTGFMTSSPIVNIAWFGQ